MSLRTYVRLVAILPASFALFGIAVVYLTLRLSAVLPPANGLLTGLLVILAAIAALGTLVAASSWSIPALLIAGVTAWAGVLVLPSIFPLRHVRSEPLSFIELYGRQSALGLIPLVTVAATVTVRALLRRAA